MALKCHCSAACCSLLQSFCCWLIVRFAFFRTSLLQSLLSRLAATASTFFLLLLSLSSPQSPPVACFFFRSLPLRLLSCCWCCWCSCCRQLFCSLNHSVSLPKVVSTAGCRCRMAIDIGWLLLLLDLMLWSLLMVCLPSLMVVCHHLWSFAIICRHLRSFAVVCHPLPSFAAVRHHTPPAAVAIADTTFLTTFERLWGSKSWGMDLRKGLRTERRLGGRLERKLGENGQLEPPGGRVA